MENNELLKEIERLQGLLAKHGICEDCGELYNHHGDEPFASCGCNQSEWYELTPHMLQVQGLKAERDALAAQFELMKSAIDDVQKYTAKSGYDFPSPSDIRTEAGRKGFIACLNFACHTPDNWISLADKYADEVRQGGE